MKTINIIIKNQLIDGAVHSLGMDDYIKSIEILKNVTQLCMSFISEE